MGLQGASFLALLAPLPLGGWFEGTSTPLHPTGLSVNASCELPLRVQPC